MISAWDFKLNCKNNQYTKDSNFDIQIKELYIIK